MLGAKATIARVTNQAHLAPLGVLAGHRGTPWWHRVTVEKTYHEQRAVLGISYSNTSSLSASLWCKNVFRGLIMGLGRRKKLRRRGQSAARPRLKAVKVTK